MQFLDISMNKLLSIFIISSSLAFCLSCGRLSQNNAVVDTLVMKDARVNGENRSMVLKFHKYSWFAQATLHYDLVIAEVKKEDPIFEWFSEINQRDLLACGRAFISAKYSFMDGIISHGFIRSQFEEQGVTEIVPTDFMIPFKLHHFFQRYALIRYKIVALCQKGTDPIVLKVQGYPPVTIP